MKTKTDPKLEIVDNDVAPVTNIKLADTSDIEALLLDAKLGDGITNVNYHSVPVGKPPNFFMTHPDPAYRRQAWIYTHKVEDLIDETHYIVAESMRGYLIKARPCTLVTVVNRAGSPRIWPIKQPRDGEKDNAAWISARSIAKEALDDWVRLEWIGGVYISRPAPEGYAPPPDWTKLPTFGELFALAFPDAHIIRDKHHAVYCDYYGIKQKADGGE
jgi:hypothetical protein